jgi:cytochrome c-type biogenesis protein CcmH/NrfF
VNVEVILHVILWLAPAGTLVIHHVLLEVVARDNMECVTRRF